MSNPVEGTLVSVARVSCESLRASKVDSLKTLVQQWHAAATAELSRTPEQLVVDGKYVLKEAHVVDSGAQGLTNIIDGMLRACQGDIDLADPSIWSVASLAAVDESTVTLSDHVEESEAFQYCTEVLIELNNEVNETEVKQAFAGMETAGACDSVACVVGPTADGTGRLAKVHVHTNEPDNVFALAKMFSSVAVLAKEKVEDMVAQKKEAHASQGTEDETKKRVSFIMCPMGCIPHSEIQDTELIPVRAGRMMTSWTLL